MLNPLLSPGDYSRKGERFTSVVSTHELQSYIQESLSKWQYLEVKKIAINFKCIMFYLSLPHYTNPSRVSYVQTVI